jgi:hypothetical protein
MDERTWCWDDPILGALQQEERAKLSPFPDADDDFIALEKALERYRVLHPIVQVSKLIGVSVCKNL